MNITKQVNGENLIVNISGRLDTSTAPEFDAYTNEHFYMTENNERSTAYEIQCL